ncbi:MAG: hypothetical protein LBH59_00285 [Planctomycetaceae bacterium]|nr:hypothetical protein [Planctomycetaceae bacterium]
MFMGEAYRPYRLRYNKKFYSLKNHGTRSNFSNSYRPNRNGRSRKINQRFR